MNDKLNAIMDTALKDVKYDWDKAAELAHGRLKKRKALYASLVDELVHEALKVRLRKIVRDNNDVIAAMIGPPKGVSGEAVSYAETKETHRVLRGLPYQGIFGQMLSTKTFLGDATWEDLEEDCAFREKIGNTNLAVAKWRRVVQSQLKMGDGKKVKEIMDESVVEAIKQNPDDPVVVKRQRRRRPKTKAA